MPAGLWSHRRHRLLIVDHKGRSIGSGTYGDVTEHEAVDTRTNTKLLVAVKTTTKDDGSKDGGPRAAERRVLERDILNDVHINIVQYYGEVICNEKVALAFEYCEKGSLKGMITQMVGKKPENVRRLFLSYARDLLCGLVYLRKKQINHRDIKPENIVIDKFDTAKIADFGFALKLNDDANERVVEHWVGTPYYMAPEVWDKSTSYSVDVYASGVTFISMFNEGHRPWQFVKENKVIKYLQRHGSTETKALLARNDNDEELEKQIKRRVKKQRYIWLRRKMLKGPVWDELSLTTNHPEVVETIKRMISRDVKKRPEAIDLLLEESSAFKYDFDVSESGSSRSSTASTLSSASDATSTAEQTERSSSPTSPENKKLKWIDRLFDHAHLDTIFHDLSRPSSPNKASKPDRDERQERLRRTILNPSPEDLLRLKREKEIARWKAESQDLEEESDDEATPSDESVRTQTRQDTDDAVAVITSDSPDSRVKEPSVPIVVSLKPDKDQLPSPIVAKSQLKDLPKAFIQLRASRVKKGRLVRRGAFAESDEEDTAYTPHSSAALSVPSFASRADRQRSCMPANVSHRDISNAQA